MLVTEQSQFNQIRQEMNQSSILALDTETNWTNKLLGEISSGPSDNDGP